MAQSHFTDPTFVAKLMAHLDACKDVCDNFGVDTLLIPEFGIDPTGKNDKIVNGFTVKSYRNPYTVGGTFSQDGTNMKFAPDPFWKVRVSIVLLCVLVCSI